MRVDVKRHFGARRRHLGKRRHTDRNVIADPMSFNDGLIRTFRQQSSAKMRNHSEPLYGNPRAGTGALASLPIAKSKCPSRAQLGLPMQMRRQTVSTSAASYPRRNK